MNTAATLRADFAVIADWIRPGATVLDLCADLHELLALGVGALRPGERLPIGDLAEAMHLSQMPIREALRRLDADGLVENIPHRGASVAGLTVEDLVEVYDARLLLELPAIEGAARSFGADDERDAAAGLERSIRYAISHQKAERHALAVRRRDDLIQERRDLRNLLKDQRLNFF